MRPRLLAQARLSGMRRVTPATDFGWAVTQPGEGTVSLFDRDLRAVATVPIPFDAPQVEVGATDRLIAVADKHEIAVSDHGGAVQWRRTWAEVGGHAGVDFGLDGTGVLWVRAAGRLVALDAATGEEIHRIWLPGPEGARFIHRTADTWTGLTLVDPDTCSSGLAAVEAGRIALRPLAELRLFGFSPAGGRYLTVSFDEQLSVREVATDAVIAERHLDDLPDKPTSLADRSDLDRAMFVTDELILIVISAVDRHTDVEHLLLAAHSLRCRSQLRYPHLFGPGVVHPAPTPGRWLTRHLKEDLLQLWQLDDRLDDEPPPGQLALLDR
jgi:hypothetical protein